MGTLFVYILKSSLCLALFYLFYRWLLSKETFHRFNRFALLGVLLLSLIVPLCHISLKETTEVHQTLLNLEQLLLLYGNDDAIIEIRQAPAFSWIKFTLLLYGIGVMFFFFRNLYSVMRMWLLLKHSKKEKLDSGIILITHCKEMPPFSWLRYIVISEKDKGESEKEIITHELAHINKRHWLDLLLSEITILFHWFNPAAWLLKQEMQNIHEYEADESVINQGIDAKQYQLLLIKKAVGSVRFNSLANSFNHSKLKKRITMMLKEKSSPWARLKYLYILPLTAVAITTFARPEISNKLDEISQVKVNDFSLNIEEKQVNNSDVIVAKGGTSETKLGNNYVVPDSAINKQTGKIVPLDNGFKIRTEDGVFPLVMLDGKEISKQEMETVDPKSISSIEVLKDKSAIEFYGEKGKHGVILISLKKEEKVSVTSVGGENIKNLGSESSNGNLIDENQVYKDCSVGVCYKSKPGKYIWEIKDFTLKELREKFRKSPVMDDMVVVTGVLNDMKPEMVDALKNTLREGRALKVNMQTKSAE